MQILYSKFDSVLMDRLEITDNLHAATASLLPWYHDTGIRGFQLLLQRRKLGTALQKTGAKVKENDHI